MWYIWISVFCLLLSYSTCWLESRAPKLIWSRMKTKVILCCCACVLACMHAFVCARARFHFSYIAIFLVNSWISVILDIHSSCWLCLIYLSSFAPFDLICIMYAGFPFLVMPSSFLYPEFQSLHIYAISSSCLLLLLSPFFFIRLKICWFPFSYVAIFPIIPWITIIPHIHMASRLLTELLSNFAVTS